VAKPASGLLADALAACRGGFAALALFTFGINLLMLTAPLYMMQVFDRVLLSRSAETLILLTLIACFALLVMGGLDACRGFLMVRISDWLDRRLAGVLLADSIGVPLRSGGEASVQSLRDLSTYRTFLTGPAMFPILDAPWSPIFIGVIFLLHPTLGWVSLFGAAVLFVLAIANERATATLLQKSSVASMLAMR